MSDTSTRTVEGLCVELVQQGFGWESPLDEGGLKVTTTWSDHTVSNDMLTYPPKYSETGTHRDGSPRQVWNSQSERTTYIAGWLDDLVKQHGILGWVVGNGTLCHMTNVMAAKLDINNIKHRRKQVYSICLETVNPHDPKPCGKPIYEHGMEVCSVHQRRAAALEAERAATRAAAAERNRIEKERDDEIERVREVISQSAVDLSHVIGTPYKRTRERWGKRKGQFEHVPVVRSGYSDTTPIVGVTIPIEMYLAMYTKLTGNEITLDPPKPVEPERPTEPVVAMEGVVNPFA